MADSGQEERPHQRRSPSPEVPSHRYRCPSQHRSRRTRSSRSPNRRGERHSRHKSPSVILDRLSSRRSSPRSTAGHRSPSPRRSSYRSQSQSQQSQQSQTRGRVKTEGTNSLQRNHKPVLVRRAGGSGNSPGERRNMDTGTR
ncbi:serine/arginine repetitive matrix protein 5-like [Haliotis rufescens]|uniref:serine/arginine repetitive matrix protein 5-like n=1 Tax=Haliotis rufescens TaxID=6454 RepID=UPI00201EE809|nr:serine/arginine repetitive matrix protein 5-like [Haliotis rufescens]